MTTAWQKVSFPAVAAVLVVVGGWLALSSGNDIEVLAERVPAPGEAMAAEVSDGTLVWITNNGADVKVVEALSPRYGLGFREVVSWCPASRELFDWYSATRWDEDGRWVGGPARADLAVYEAQSRGGRVVLTGDRREGAPREDAQPQLSEHAAQAHHRCRTPHADAAVHPVDSAAISPVELAAVDEDVSSVVVRGTLMAGSANTLKFCDGREWRQPAADCPTVYPTDASHGVEAHTVWIAVTMVADRRDGALTDLRLLPGSVALSPDWSSLLPRN